MRVGLMLGKPNKITISSTLIDVVRYLSPTQHIATLSLLSKTLVDGSDSMPAAYFRFYGNLNDFLPPERQQIEFPRRLKDRGSIKDTIEGVGVPHPEVSLILVNGKSVSFDYLVQAGDRISVYPQFTALDITHVSQVQPPPLPESRFVLDVHLGKLAAYLRILGFDTLYRNDYDDDELAEISSQENRILLTQDRGLLKRGKVTYGYAVRSPYPEEQIVEILERFELGNAIAPLQRCPRCNGTLKQVNKEQVLDRIPYYTRLTYDEFAQCQQCQQVYWKGAHYSRIQALIDRIQDIDTSA
ncbi:Mut7-C RNAse domain-containing protein [Oscillatoria sp. CS-180]|uniref:Mut7-C RNAse domain-containing protein n=1 Tax=Oscillatoria sp. CS-180 TaxID=3021720 RepID=UPI00232F89C0|nr:Mut7-C RNAse domain-containing protein [Oscillatoria sp. CS-180]MDB9524917.1 Mut7-C RNAse domain-containing protein [Oscillatoria sp. CS-180]